MTKYYFFKIEREVNASHEYRTVVHPIPGQFTYKNQRNRRVPIDPALKVQLPNSQNGLACRCSTGDIIGVRLTGHSEQHTKLGIYTRNETNFYRTESPIYLVTGIGCSMLPHADEDMKAAYEALSASSEAADTAPEQTSSETPSTPRQSQPVGSDHLNPWEETRIDTLELNAVEDALRLDLGNEREALGKTLIVSQIRDRMRKGVAKFSYEKQNGDIRVAYGTRNREVIRLLGGGEEQRSGSTTEPDGRHFNYFDIQRHEWRQFCTPDVKSVQTDILITNISTIRTIAATSV